MKYELINFTRSIQITEMKFFVYVFTHKLLYEIHVEHVVVLYEKTKQQQYIHVLFFCCFANTDVHLLDSNSEKGTFGPIISRM